MQELYEAISENDFSRFSALLDNYPFAVDEKGEHPVSPLLFALYHGRPQFADALVKAGAHVGIHEAAALGDLLRVQESLNMNPADVNSFSEDGFQPLGLAAFFGHTEVAEYLLEHGADLEMPSHNDQKVAPIHSATAGGENKILLRLIEKGVDVNIKQQGGYTALHAAIRNKDLDTIRLLIQNGANCYAENDLGQKPIDLMEDGTNASIIGLLRACK